MMVRNLKNELVKSKHNYLIENFCMPGWMNYIKKDWWALLTKFILNRYKAKLQELGLYRAIKATHYWINNNPPQFFAIQELYYPFTSTFFTLNDELSIGLHKGCHGQLSIWRVFSYSGRVVHPESQKYFSLIIWCCSISVLTSQTPKETLFGRRNELIVCSEVGHRCQWKALWQWDWSLVKFAVRDEILAEDDGGFAAGTVLLNYHKWACVDLTPSMVPICYLALRLKSCIMPFLPRESLTHMAL